jgi:RNA polymerase sigma-70 factor, ECF subfamily
VGSGSAVIGKNPGTGGHVGDVVTVANPELPQLRFEALYREHYGAIYAYVVRRLEDPGVAPDVVAEVFAVAWRRLAELPEQPEDRLWLYGVARRCVAGERRSLRRRLRLWARVADAAVVAEAPGVEAATLRDAIRALPDGEREALMLVLWEGLSHAEAAAVLGCSANAVGVRLHRARGRLREVLAIEDGERVEPGLEQRR